MTAPAAPCASCPWLRSSPTDGSAIPGFSLDSLRRLRATASDGSSAGDGFRAVMACHYSRPGSEAPCRGYLHRDGYDNLVMRLEIARGEIDIKAIDEACSGLDLYPSFETMLAAYEAAAEERA